MATLHSLLSVQRGHVLNEKFRPIARAESAGMVRVFKAQLLVMSHTQYSTTNTTYDIIPKIGCFVEYCGKYSMSWISISDEMVFVLFSESMTQWNKTAIHHSRSGTGIPLGL